MPNTENASGEFDPRIFFKRWSEGPPVALQQNLFRESIIDAFNLRADDNYQYIAIAEVTLQQVQTHIDHGGRGEMHMWYRDVRHQPRINPSPTDIRAYIDIFRPTSSTSKALVGLKSNAKKDSVRADVARHLEASYRPSKITVSRSKTHVNPYFDMWAWSCENLEWGGPEAGTICIKTSHAILPVLYHHFGCIVPSYESLQLIRAYANGRRVLDMGSGNGYWTFMLRELEMSPSSKYKQKVQVLPIDNGTSHWRTMWIGDTVQADGVQWLKSNDGGRNDLLLLIYPVVGNNFTSKLIEAYYGRTIITAGSQNSSGFTAFANETIVQWMTREMPGWELTVQIPLPSFAGKDEALFVFEKSTKFAENHRM